MKRLLVVAMLLVAMLAAGCQMRIDVTTNVLPTTEMDQEVAITLQGLSDDNSQQSVQAEDEAMAADGWTREVTTEGDSVILRASKHLKLGDPLFPPNEEDSDSSKPQFNLQVIDLPDEREYRLTVLMPASESAVPQSDVADAETDLEFTADLDSELNPDLDSDPETDADLNADLESDLTPLGDDIANTLTEAFKFSWTINLPGKVVETNADIQTETGGTWEFGLDQMHSERELKLVSREPKS